MAGIVLLKRFWFFSLTCVILVLLNSCGTFSSKPWRGSVSSNFNGEVFFNQDTVHPEQSFLSVIKQIFRTDTTTWPEFRNLSKGATPPERVGFGKMRITFVNHCTFLIQYDSINVLTDPVWSFRIGPLPWPAEYRTLPAGIDFDSLPPIDLVLVSHNHYDHMDIPTLRKLRDKFNPSIITTLGNKQTLADFGITEKVIETDWWDETFLYGKRFTIVPARHFSMRGLKDRNKSLWGAFVMNTELGPVFFAGDTGDGIHFKQIRETFGEMTVSILPIAPVNPREFMLPVHLSPEEAVQAHLTLESFLSIASHFGTFKQGFDSQVEPVWLLEEAKKKYHIQYGDFRALMNGTHINIKLKN